MAPKALLLLASASLPIQAAADACDVAQRPQQNGGGQLPTLLVSAWLLMTTPEHSDARIGSWQQGSAAAGMIGRVFCHPLDTVKARLQVTAVPTCND